MGQSWTNSMNALEITVPNAFVELILRDRLQDKIGATCDTWRCAV